MEIRLSRLETGEKREVNSNTGPARYFCLGGEGEPSEADDPPSLESRPKFPPQKEQPLMPGEREITKGLLSKDASFRLIVSGHIGAKEIELLIKKT